VITLSSPNFPPWGNVVNADFDMSLSIPGSEGGWGTWPSSSACHRFSAMFIRRDRRGGKEEPGVYQAKL